MLDKELDTYVLPKFHSSQMTYQFDQREKHDFTMEKKIYHHLNESSFINKDLHGSCYDALCLVIKHSTEMFILNIISIHSSDRTYLTKGGGD